jgi:hypothetical protein
MRIAQLISPLPLRGMEWERAYVLMRFVARLFHGSVMETLNAKKENAMTSVLRSVQGQWRVRRGCDLLL